MASKVKRPPVEIIRLQYRNLDERIIPLCDYALDLERRLREAITETMEFCALGDMDIPDWVVPARAILEAPHMPDCQHNRATLGEETHEQTK